MLALIFAACEGPNDSERCRARLLDGGGTLQVPCGADCPEGEVAVEGSKADPQDAQCVFAGGLCE
jgi:hypothetical protein